MRQYLLDLCEIQKIDLAIREVEKRRSEIPAKLKDLENQLLELKSQLTKLTAQRSGVEEEIKVLDASIDTETHKLRKWEARLNEIRNQREFLALSRELDTAKRVNKEAEEKVVALKVTKAELDAQVEALQDKVAVLDIDCETERARVAAEVANIAGSVDADEARRNALLPNIPKQVLAKYENIRTRRLGVGLAAVAEGRCRACNMRLPPQMYNMLQRGESIEQCPSCQRLVYWEQFTVSSAAEA